MTTVALLSAAQEQARTYRHNGWWRDETFLDDLARWARVRPDAPAYITGRSTRRPTAAAGAGAAGAGDTAGSDDAVHVLSYRELDELVRRLAGGLYELGVRPGDVVAFQLPDWWETVALLLGCIRVGAIAQPMVPDLRAREVERALGRTSARVCVTVDSWQGYDHAGVLAEMAPRLPHLRHRVVYGDAARTDALDFHECLVRGPDEPSPASVASLDPDRPCLVLFTSGSTGEAKGVLHSLNTIYAGTSGFTAETAGTAPQADRAAATLRVSHIAGPLWSVFGTLLTGGTGVFQDAFDPDQMLDLMVLAGATRLLSPPPKLSALVAAQRSRPRRLEALHTVCTGATTIPTELVPAVQEAFGLPLRAVWGMTEIVVGTVVSRDDPPDWSASSDGRALPGLELRVVTPDGGEGTGALQVRGAALCLGTITDDIGRITPSGDSDGGWFDTGDLARPDGRGGIRIVGRMADRIYDPAAVLMIPVRDVEDELLGHPGVADVAIVACNTSDGSGEDVCAVVVPAGEPPTLADLREYLDKCGMTEYYQPTRVEILDRLPRDPLGKIRKHELRARFEGAAARPS
jgi:cyclohexanecarboxylate-CoA ligase